MRFKNLFFDLDGTLTHPHEGITRCIQHALKAAGVDPPAATELLQFVGPPLRDSFAVLLATTDDARLDEALSAYRARFETIGIFENSLCPGIPVALERLAGADLQLSVVTAKPTVFARRVLAHFGLGSFFDGVYGPDLSSRGYTKASLIRAALEASRALPHLTAMVGDRGEDIAGARDNGVHGIAVAWGYATDGELAAAKPDRIVQSPRELVEYVERAA